MKLPIRGTKKAAVLALAFGVFQENIGVNHVNQGQRMYLMFPRAMTIPEVASRREDHHFEDWLTATLIENTNRGLPDANESCVPGIIDLWMLEIAERNGRMWTGKFNVEFENDAQERSMNHRPREVGTGMLFFSLDTDTGEIRFA